MTSAIISLADNQKFNFSKYIIDNMVKSLEGGIKLYLFLRFLQVFLDKQVEGMARHKEMYVISSHTKKIFANIRRIRAGFSGIVTPLFKTMMKKQKPRRKQRKEAEVSHDELKDEDHVPTPSSDPLPSEAKNAQSKEIAALKKKVSKLLKWRKSRSGGLRRLMKIGLGRRVISPLEKDSLGAQEDASKQGRMIKEIDQDDEISLDADTAAPTKDVTEDKITMAQALATLKSVKPTIPAVATKVAMAVPTPRAKGFVFHEQKQSHIPTFSSSKDKGKAKLIEPEVPIKKKDQIKMDEEYARQLEAEEQEAARLQAREREELSEDQKARLEMRKINSFIAMDSEAQKSSGKEAQESSTKRTKESLESEISKKQKVDKNVEPVIDDTKELKKFMEIVLDDGDEVLIKATPISSRSPTIIDYKIHKEGKKNYFKIIRADGNSQVYQTFEKMFKNFNREDVEVLWAIVKDRFKKEKPVDDMDNLMFRTFKTMFKHNVEDVIWTYQYGLAKVYPLTRNTVHQLWNDVRLQVDHDAEMAYDLLRFIRK
nr:hypothetical protein [Tanacetum cinerariifolium]